MFRHLSTDTDITQNKITYWFKADGKKLGLRYEGKKQTESIVHSLGDTEQTLTCSSSEFMIRIRQEKELIK